MEVGILGDIFLDPAIAIGKLKKKKREKMGKKALQKTLLAVWYIFGDKKKNKT